jgi:hypothetical protein
MKPGDLVRVMDPSGRPVIGVWLDSGNHWRALDIEGGSLAVLVEHDVVGSQKRVLVRGGSVWIGAEFVQPAGGDGILAS